MQEDEEYVDAAPAFGRNEKNSSLVSLDVKEPLYRNLSEFADHISGKIQKNESTMDDLQRQSMLHQRYNRQQVQSRMGGGNQMDPYP